MIIIRGGDEEMVSDHVFNLMIPAARNKNGLPLILDDLKTPRLFKAGKSTLINIPQVKHQLPLRI